jgi:uncharacterized DUF497 family protein
VHTNDIDRHLDFEWDDAKRASNVGKHGIDLIEGRKAFDRRECVSHPSNRDGEARTLTLFEMDGRILALVWTGRSGAVRLISLRAARQGEARAYRSNVGR